MRASEGGCRLYVAPQQARHNFGRFPAAGVGVNVRVGVVGDERVRQFDQARADIAVHIQQNHDRHGVADDGARPRHDIRFGVQLPLGDHRAMQGQQNSSERQAL